jgi:hypothetical protein
VFGVCFRREKHPALQDQWSHVFSNFGVEEIWERGYAEGDGKIYQTVIPIDLCSELPSDRPTVVLASQEGRYIKGEENLLTFAHPANAIYIFGGSHVNLTYEDDLGGLVPDHLVYIPTVKHETFSHVAASVVLWDRLVKIYG